MADEMQVSLPEGVIKPIIQAQVVAALQGQERLITEMVSFILTQKIRDEPSYQMMPMIEVLSRKLLREAIEASIREWVNHQRPAIQKEVERQMRGQIKGFASRLVAATASASEQAWRLSIKVDLGKE